MWVWFSFWDIGEFAVWGLYIELPKICHFVGKWCTLNLVWSKYTYISSGVEILKVGCHPMCWPRHLYRVTKRRGNIFAYIPNNLLIFRFVALVRLYNSTNCPIMIFNKSLLNYFLICTFVLINIVVEVYNGLYSRRSV